VYLDVDVQSRKIVPAEIIRQLAPPASPGSFVAVGGVVTLLATAAGLVTRLRGFFSPLVVVLVVLVA
jgi:xanthine/uracil permease